MPEKTIQTLASSSVCTTFKTPPDKFLTYLYRGSTVLHGYRLVEDKGRLICNKNQAMSVESLTVGLLAFDKE